MSGLMNEAGLLDTQNIVNEVEDVFPRALQLIGDATRTGAVLTIVGVSEESLFELRCMLGTAPADKRAKYWAFSMEKAQRLLAHPNHDSSFESRNEAELQYGGAVRAQTCIISLSGLPEKWDEAVTLVLACRTGVMDEKKAGLIAQANQNPHFKELLQEV